MASVKVAVRVRPFNQRYQKKIVCSAALATAGEQLQGALNRLLRFYLQGNRYGCSTHHSNAREDHWHSQLQGCFLCEARCCFFFL